MSWNMKPKDSIDVKLTGCQVFEQIYVWLSNKYDKLLAIYVVCVCVCLYSKSFWVGGHQSLVP